MPVTWYDGIVEDIQPLAPNVKSFNIKIPELARFDFQAGQFITMDLPIGEKRLQRWRSYSIANAPGGDNELELCIVQSSAGDGTRYLFQDLQPGDALRFKGPDGAFVLPENIDKDLVFICTGTGVAPFRSMIQALYKSGKPHRNVHLIFGCRTESDILYRAEFEELKQKMPGFSYDVALSRQENWPGYRGHIHGIYLEKYAEKRPDVAFYLCGWSAMIDEAVENLVLKLGYDRTQIHYELYG